MTDPRVRPRPTVIASFVLQGLLSAFFLFDAVGHLFKLPQFVGPSEALGYANADIPLISVALLVGLIPYVIPRTAVLGAVLITGYLGGAAAVNLVNRLGAGGIAFPVLFGVMTWGFLALRDGRVRLLTAPKR